MWLTPILLLVLVLAVIGDLVVGGVYALILIPILLVVVIVGLVGAASTRFGRRRPPPGPSASARRDGSGDTEDR